MRAFKLLQETLQELKAAHHSVSTKRDAYKIHALILLGEEHTQQFVSEVLLLDEDTIRRYWIKYETGGLDALLETKHKGSSKKLDTEQINQLCEELDRTIYLNTKSICNYVKNTFGVDYTIGGMTDLLHALGYAYKKPTLVPANPDEEEQEIFVKQAVEFLKNKRENEAVFFVDAIHPTYNVVSAYGWIRKGYKKEIKSTSGRRRLNIHGAMNAETHETTVIAGEDSVNSESTIALFKQLENVYPLAVVIHVILDNAKYHYSQEVLSYVKTSRINLVPLPTYSPELNLIERLWRVFKKNVLYNKYYDQYEKFKDACFGFFKNQSVHYEEIHSIMGEGLLALV